MSVIVSPLIEYQIYESFVMFFGGLSVMLCFEAFQALKKNVKPGKTVELFLNILYWVLAALLTVSFLNYAAFGKISFHCSLAFVIGLLLWKKCFYGTIHKE